MLESVAAAQVASSRIQGGPIEPAAQQELPERARETFARLPLAFERAPGGGDRFVARSQGYTVALEKAKATVAMARTQSGKDGSVVALEFAGGHAGHARPGTELPGKINYIRGNDPKTWQIGLPTYDKVSWADVYPGIDVVYYGTQRQIEFDLVVKAGADPGLIRMKVSGADGVRLGADGALELGEAAGGLRITLPRIYQEVNGARESVPGRFAITGQDEVAFRVEHWDRTRALVIDPTIVNAFAFGGATGYATGSAVALDSSGNILIAGATQATDLPVANAVQSGLSGSGAYNAFVTKINAAGTTLIYSTYLGGSGGDQVAGMAVDSSGSAWITGSTSSADFPMLNAAQSLSGGSGDAFVARLSSTGALQFSTFLGGSGYDAGAGIAIDGSGNGYVTGSASSGFPTTAGVLKSTSASQNAFVAKYSPTGALQYSTLLGEAAAQTPARESRWIRPERLT